MAVPQTFNTVAPGSRGPLEVLDGSDWRQVPKLTSASFTATSPSETTTEFISEPPSSRSGQAGPGSVSYGLIRAPQMRAYRVLREAFEAGTELSFRDWGGIPERFSNPATATSDTIAIANTGVVTLAGSLNAGTDKNPAQIFTPGRVLVIAAVAYTIESVTGAKALTVSRLGAVASGIVTPDDTALGAVAATASWVSVKPASRRDFTGRVTTVGAYGREASDEGATDELSVNIHTFPTDLIVVEDN